MKSDKNDAPAGVAQSPTSKKMHTEAPPAAAHSRKKWEQPDVMNDQGRKYEESIIKIFALKIHRRLSFSLHGF